jgi:limonene-1,2-epoxide hydrolase
VATSAQTAQQTSSAEPAEIVRSFLLALQAGELDQALALVADDIVYTNVSLPTLRGRARIDRLFRPALESGRGGFRVHFHTVAANGQTVLTERTDALIFGPIEQRIWVYGRFDVIDGRIVLWRDSFDWLDLLIGLIRGVAGALVPALNRPWPGDTPPLEP